MEFVSIKDVIEAQSPRENDKAVYRVVIKMVRGQHLIGGHALGFDLRWARAERRQVTIIEPHG